MIGKYYNETDEKHMPWPWSPPRMVVTETRTNGLYQMFNTFGFNSTVAIAVLLI